MQKTFAQVLATGLAVKVQESNRKSIGTAESGFFSQWGWNTGVTTSGKTINVDTALTNDTVWACVRLIAEAVATLPLGIYRRQRDGSKVFESEHDLYELLHHQPNAKMSAVSFWEAIVASMLLWGNGYAEIIRRNNGSIISLEFLNPALITLGRDNRGFLTYGQIMPDGSTRPIRRENILHCKSFTLNGEVGISAIQYGRNSIGASLSADEASDEAFKDATRASGVINVDAMMKDTHRTEIRKHVAEVSRLGGVYVLEKGMSFAPLTFSPADAELLASRSFSVETICRWFRTPPVMIGHGDKQSSWPTSTEAQGALFLRYVLRGIIAGIEQEIRRSIIMPSERPVVSAEFAIEGLLRGDSAARSTFYSQMVQNGIYSRDDCRRLENLPPMGGNAALLTVQSNLLPIDKLGITMPVDNTTNADNGTAP